jgi:hypothetical protein
MRRMSLVLFLIALIGIILLLRSNLLLAETVRLKNGTVVRGAIVQMNETDLTVDTADMGQITVKRRAVQSFGDEAADAAPALVTVAAGAASAPAAGAPVGISINNNNNNNNTSTASSAATVEVAPEPAAPLTAQIAAPPSAGGFVIGNLGAGVRFLRFSS